MEAATIVAHADIEAAAAAIASALGGRRAGNGWKCHCPVPGHGKGRGDQNPSLSVWVENGRLMVRCHAGCPRRAVVEELRRRGLWPEADNGESRRIVAVYDYTDENGRLLHQTLRFEPKAFAQRAACPRGGGCPGVTKDGKPLCYRDDEGRWWHRSLDGVRTVLYRLPEVLAAVQAGQRVYIVEGEKDVESLRALGLVATTAPMGAGKWRPEYSEALRGAHVVIIPDRDEPGRRHAEQVARSLYGVAVSVKVLELPGDVVKDVSNWLQAGGTREELERLADEAPEWTPSAISVSDVDEIEPALPTPPPSPDPAAFHGLAGEVVEAFDPYTEADPVAVLAQFLVVFGNVIGRTAHVRVGADRHHGNLFVCLVGPSARGRKGSSWRLVAELFEAATPGYIAEHVANGLSSGEGLIWAVRDPVSEEDQGVADKRLLVVEEEFASPIRVMRREGNTLSPVLRRAWDGGVLRILTKNTPAKATGAHVSIIGHITSQELRRNLSETEAANGFANRFLWLWVHRSKLLPDGAEVPEEAYHRIVPKLRAAIEFASSVGAVQRSKEAAEAWRRVYPALTEVRPGLFGAVTSRAEAQVLRLGLLYALLDRSPVIRLAHLRASLALWEYAEASARYIFGDATGDAIADEILEALRQSPDGLTRTQVRDIFQRNVPGHRIDRAIATLLELGLVEQRQEAGQRGRPATKLVAVSTT